MTRYLLFLLTILFSYLSYGQDNFYRLIDQGQEELEAGNYIGARYELEKALQIIPEKILPEDIAVLYNNLGVVCYETGFYKEGLQNYQLALKYYRMSEIDTLIAGALYNLGLTYYDLGLSGHAVKALLDAANIFEKKEKRFELAQVWSVIGSVYRDIKSYNKSIKYHNKALSIFERINDETGITECYQNLGNVYFELKHYSKAKWYLTIALKRKIKFNQLNIVSSLSALGRLYLDLGDKQKAYFFLKKAYEIRLEAGNSRKSAESLLYIAIYYFSNGDKIKALELFRQVQDISHSEKNWKLLAESLEGEIKILEGLSDSYNLIKKYPELLSAREKLIEDANHKEVEKFEIKYSSDLKDRTIENQNISNSRLKISLLLSGLLITSVGFGWYKLRQRKKQIELKNLKLEDQKRQITNLHYELSHRTKNYFGFLSGLLKSDRRQATNEEAIRLLSNNARRADALSLIQSYLLHDSTRNNQDVELKTYFSRLIEELLLNLLPNDNNLILTCDLEVIYMDYDRATHFAIVLNELICNSIEHGLRDNYDPKLNISLKLNEGLIILIVHDNGIGILSHLDKIQEQKGLGIIAKLIKNLKGTVAYNNDSGCMVTVTTSV